jgi:hypothetical protein
MLVIADFTAPCAIDRCFRALLSGPVVGVDLTLGSLVSLLSPQRGFVHNRRIRKVCGPRRTEACDLAPERCVDCYSTITKLRR